MNNNLPKQTHQKPAMKSDDTEDKASHPQLISDCNMESE